jgi:hypothetical protein
MRGCELLASFSASQAYMVKRVKKKKLAVAVDLFGFCRAGLDGLG